MKKLEKFNKLVEKFTKQDALIAVVSDFLDWFIRKLEIHFLKKLKYNFVPKKWDIFYVDLWKNVGAELNKIRPCIIYSNRKFNAWWTVIIIPLRSYKWKNKNFFVKIDPNNLNNLENVSLVDILSIRQVDKKRLLNRIWQLDNKSLKDIDNIVIKIFWIKK